MKTNYYLRNRTQSPIQNKNGANWRLRLTMLFSLLFILVGYAQKGKGGNNKDIIPVVTCVKDLRNGLYQASFAYENPTNKEVTIDENGSIVKSNNGKRVAKGLNKFKPGNVNKVFTKEFGPGDYVEWTIISNGNTHTVIANANSSKCAVDDGFIEPVLFNGKTNESIGQELRSLCDAPDGLILSPLIFQLKDEKVLIEIVPLNGYIDEVIDLLNVTFGVPFEDFLLYDDGSLISLVDQLNGFAAIDVYLTKEVVCSLNDYAIGNLKGNVPWINFARPVYPATTNSGGVITQGDAAQKSNLVRESFRIRDSVAVVQAGITDSVAVYLPVDGTGITIGVMSDSYAKSALGVNDAANDVAGGELPDDVLVLKDNAFEATDEGRAMMQIIHDVAPGAKLQFHTVTASPRQFEEGVNALAVNSDILVDDVTFITEPFFGTGRISNEIENFLSSGPGKFHITSAGNLANKGYQDTLVASENVPVTNFIPLDSPTRAHLFDGPGGTDYLQEISVVPGTYLIALQWKEDLASQNNSEGALDDLDIYIVDDLGRLLVGSNRVNIAGDPTEIIVFRATGSGNANILITSANGDPVDDFGNPKTLPFRYIAFRTSAEDGKQDGLKFEEYFGDGAPTVSGHAMNPRSITTGAVGYRYADPPIAETFSSYGGLLSDDTTLEIDLYAPDGGNTSSTTIGQLEVKDEDCPTCDDDGALNFYGTSAAAPHLAGAVALLMSTAPSWFPDGYSADDAMQLFKSSATPFTAANGSAAGFLNTLSAFKNIAAPIAKITELRVNDTITPSAEPFTVTIIGEFFPENSDDLEILFDGQPLDNVQILTEDGNKVITASVPIFSGNPELFVVTNGITDGGTDGGPSNPLTFFDDGKLALNIKPKSAEFEYGQDITSYYRANPNDPGFPFYTVEGLPDGVTFESLGLPPVILNNSLLDSYLENDDYPFVADYRITPSFGDQDYDQELFQINFIGGTIDSDGKIGYLTITKKDLTITPHPTYPNPMEPEPYYTYGDPIDLTLNYSYDATGILDNSLDFGFYGVIDASHKSDFKDGLPNKFRAVVSKFRAVVSEYDLVSLLDGGSWSASDRTIQNKFRAVVSTMNVIDLDTDDFTNYIDARKNFDDDVTNKFRAVVSKFRAVVSAEDLFSGDVDLGIENKFRAVVSKFRAVVSTQDSLRPYRGYESVFSIIDAQDAPPLEDEDGYPDPERAISDMYSLNMITGLEVTPEGETHYVYPGAFLNTMSANFNITYVPGSLIIKRKVLTASTNNLVIPYGTALTQDDLSTTFDGWAFENEFQESVETVFVDPDCVQEELAEGEICPIVIPYYFVRVGDAEETQLEIGDLNELGDYLIKIRNPKNYEITNIVDDDNELGTLTIEAATLTFNPLTITATYGETPVIDTEDAEDAISGFAYGDTAAVLEGDDGRIPYYFVDASGNTFGLDDNLNASPVVDGIRVGYDIFITDDPNDNYVFIPDAKLGTLIIEPATLNFDLSTITATYGETPVIDTEDTEDAISGFAYGDTAAVLEGDDGRIPYYFVDASGNTFGLDDNLNASPVVDGIRVGYDIFITDDPNDNYVFIPDAKLGTLIILPAPLTFTSSDISITYGDDPPVIDTEDAEDAISGFAYGDTAAVLEGDDGRIPYYFVDASGNTFGLDDNLNAGDYDIIITDDPSDNYDLIPDFTPEGDVKLGNLIVNKAVLYVRTGDLVIDEGATIDTSNIEPTITTITGDVYDETVQFSIEDEEGIAYTPGDTGIYFIKIVEPDNYRIEYTRLGTVYINSNDVNRKIRTYTDCVEDNPGDPDDLFYIAHFRYENPNDEAIYILEGQENRLTGPAALTAIGVLPIKFLPGEHTFEIRFDGTTLKWELTSLDSNHKTSTTTNVNANSNQCDSNSTTNDSGIPIYKLYPNPVDGDSTLSECEPGVLCIEQDISAIVTLDVFDLTGMLVESLSNTTLDGTIAPPTTHKIDMNGLEAGIYFIRLSTGNDVQVFSVVKD